MGICLSKKITEGVISFDLFHKELQELEEKEKKLNMIDEELTYKLIELNKKERSLINKTNELKEKEEKIALKLIELNKIESLLILKINELERKRKINIIEIEC